MSSDGDPSTYASLVDVFAAADAIGIAAAVEQAELGAAEGGIPIGSSLVDCGRELLRTSDVSGSGSSSISGPVKLIGKGRNRRVQLGSPTRHGEIDCLEQTGRKPAQVYRRCTLYTTLSPCNMCTGAILFFGIPRVVVCERRTILGDEALLKQRGVSVVDAPESHGEQCYALMQAFIAQKPDVWKEDAAE
eukprot:TRINITY_DN58241_c0_g1_i1.p1 TRINITY_DN58241_c0_g1~~TRINITY_DN58241_c0_g1_i1.p1  ORF type:complete len:190 (+),score=6.31 TRINITY_DN58241_c0_g1_i1:65-634(+)